MENQANAEGSYDKKPWDTMPDPPEEAYSYLYLRFSKPDTYIEKGIIEFSINSTWLEENDVDPYSVSVYRFVDNEWNEIETVAVLDNETNIIFNAVTPGFSYFAITGGFKSGFGSLSMETGEVQSNEKGTKEEGIESAPVETPSPPPVTQKPKAEEMTKSDTGSGEDKEPSTVVGRVYPLAREVLPIAAVLAVIGAALYYIKNRRKEPPEKGKGEVPPEN